MPSFVHIFNLSPNTSAEDYFKQDNAPINVKPDGTGLQILFKVEDQYYVLAGARANRVITTNGGKVEEQGASFFAQLQEEMAEETFGQLELKQVDDRIFLEVKDLGIFPLTMHEDKTVIKGKPMSDNNPYAYVTFTATCEGLTLEQLQGLSERLSPTAVFWATLGNFLHQHKNAPRDETFKAYWQEQQDHLNNVLADLTKQYQTLAASNQLFITPQDAFEVDTIEQAWDKLRQLDNSKDLSTIYRHTAGRYSERLGYHVFKAGDLLAGAHDNKRAIADHEGTQRGVGVFNDDAIKHAFSKLGIPSANLAKDVAAVASLGAVARKSSESSGVSAEEIQPNQTSTSVELN